jgi:hypothetical protein
MVRAINFLSFEGAEICWFFEILTPMHGYWAFLCANSAISVVKYSITLKQPLTQGHIVC